MSKKFRSFKAAFAGGGMVLYAGFAMAHTDALGFLISAGSSEGLYTAQIFYGSWHDSGLYAAEGAFMLNGAEIRPYAEAYLTQELNDSRTDTQPALDGATFATSSPSAGRTGARLGSGVAVKISGNTDIFLDYRANLSSHGAQQSMKAGFSVKW